MFCLVILFFLTVGSSGSVEQWDTLEACHTGKSFELKPQCSKSSEKVAAGKFRNAINETGWSFLELKTTPTFSDKQQAYAAGILEGNLTASLIYMQWINTVQGYCAKTPKYCKRLKNYLNINLKWLNHNIAQNRNCTYWRQVELMLIQLAGLSDGYMGQVRKEPHTIVDPFGVLMFQITGELGSIEKALNKPTHLRKQVVGSGSCSVLIKLVNGGKDLLLAHDTWSTYQTMLRILKKYELNYHHPNGTLIPGHTISMSSYPGLILSIDDFYLTSAKMAVTETTIENQNSDLWRYVRPVGTVPTWIRVMVATRLSTNGEKWARIFSEMNSGTYNNQWMIVDYKLFEPSKPLQKNLFWVLEQMPGYIHADDMTHKLIEKDQGYWPSYNVPYFKDIFNISGSWKSVEKYGDWFTYDKTPRAQIFKRDQQEVQDLISLQSIMRYNNYKKDPLSRCNCTPPYSAENAISARCDLNPQNGTYPFASLGHRSHGGIDMKAVNSTLINTMNFVAISGPTTSSGLPPFQWSTAQFDGETPHLGHPDRWDFDTITTNWSN